jgi:hypothetical protein
VYNADVDLTKNPKDIGKDIKRGVEKVTPNLPDLSEAPSPVDTAASQRDQVPPLSQPILSLQALILWCCGI